MSTAVFRFYAELNDFLPPARHQVEFRYSFLGSAAVKDLVEGLGVPHPEVDLVLLNGEPVDFAHQVQDGDRVSVYPVFESLEIGGVTQVRSEPPREPRFLLDGHLGRLARFLRLLGFDTAYSNHADDQALASRSADEGRILLTRDRGLLKRSVVNRGYLVRSSDPQEQLMEVVRRFHLGRVLRPFTRCLRCNGVLQPVDKVHVQTRLPARTRMEFEDFTQCPVCGRVYWKGSHYHSMLGLVDAVRLRSAEEGETRR